MTRISCRDYSKKVANCSKAVPQMYNNIFLSTATQKKKRNAKVKQSETYLYLLGFLDLTVPSVREPEAFIAPEDE